MGKKLAILGHSTRGKEVIELLEMMGGSNIYKLSGNDIYSYYIIKGFKNEIHNELYIFGNEDIYYFTLEKFLEKYPFKIGDKVIDTADGCPGIVNEMKWDEDVSDMKYCVVFGNGIDFGWFVNDSIEFCKNKNLDETKVESTGFMQVCKTAGIIFNDANYADEVELYLGDYEIEVRDGRTYAVLKKPVYPKTYKECRAILNYMVGCLSGYKSSLLASLQNLLVCRDAYWKIAGKQMGLDKPWEPDWNDQRPKYTITVIGNQLIKHHSLSQNYILAFPTEEMRDAFYENFKDLIEQCKELL